MQSINSLVPGFEKALERFPGAPENLRRLEVARREDLISDRSQALIGVAVAHRLGGPYARWVMERAAHRAGLNAEETFLASVGTAVNARDDKAVKAAWRSSVSIKSTGNLAPHIEYAALACTILAMMAPPLGVAEPSPRKG